MSEYNQLSFLGGMNLLLDDTRLQNNQYRLAFNCHNRYDVLDPVHKSYEDTAAPTGVKQAVVTFGNYVILFCAGFAYYKAYNEIGWTKIDGFSMSPTAPRFWTESVPIATTNYGRIANSVTIDTKVLASSLGGVSSINNVSAAFAGNLPGLLVQDNINQPQFIFLAFNGYPTCRITQTYSQWNAEYDPATGQLKTDEREYVPIGNTMSWVDNVLYIASQDGNSIYRSVSGRPLDFVVNVTIDGDKGGNADTTSYSVGAGGISCLRGMNDGSLFVAASNANFIVSKNMTPSAPTLFGEYTFIRRYLFEATCLSDRCIIDSLGDTKFIDLTGIRSFNAVQQIQNEGRNSVFTSAIAAAFKNIIQDTAAAILYNNYELYGVDTIFGPAIAVFDTIANAWTSFDIGQTGGSKIKEFAKIELGVQRLFAITEDNKLFMLYDEDQDFETAAFMTLGISSNVLAQINPLLVGAKSEVKVTDFRCILNRITEDSSISITPFINNRKSSNVQSLTKDITYMPPDVQYLGNIPDLNTQLTNVYFTLPNLEQGWKVNLYITWSGGGSFTQFSTQITDVTPMNPLLSQRTVK